MGLAQRANTDEVHQNKIEKRTYFKQKLEALSDTEIMVKSRHISDQLISLFSNPTFLSQNVGSFMAIQKEPKLDGFHDWLVSRSRKLYLPKVVGTEEIQFFSYDLNSDELEEGAFSIKEPKFGGKAQFTKNDVVLVPGLAFDRQGRRLGRGKAYYDRFLAANSVVKVGVCLSVQCSDVDLPVDSHDQAMDYVVTESQVLKIDKES